MIELRAASKTFDAGGRSVTAVDGVDLQVEAGETLCLIGPRVSVAGTIISVQERIIKHSPTAKH